MSNKVITEVEFEVHYEERGREIYDTIRIDNKFVFDTVGPTPFDIYCDAMGQEEYKDDLWHQKHHELITHMLFAEYKCCEISSLERRDGKAFAFNLNTPWDVPYQVLLSFGNKFKVPYKLNHITEDASHWGVERYELNENGLIERTSKHHKLLLDWYTLNVNLLGAEPDLETFLCQFGLI